MQNVQRKLTKTYTRNRVSTYKNLQTNFEEIDYGNIQTSSENTTQRRVLQGLYPRGSQNQARLHQHGQVGNEAVHRQGRQYHRPIRERVLCKADFEVCRTAQPRGLRQVDGQAGNRIRHQGGQGLVLLGLCAPAHQPHDRQRAVAKRAKLQVGTPAHGAVCWHDEGDVRAAHIHFREPMGPIAGADAQGEGDVPGVHEAGVPCGGQGIQRLRQQLHTHQDEPLGQGEDTTVRPHGKDCHQPRGVPAVLRGSVAGVENG